MLYNDEIVTDNNTLEDNLRILRNPQGLMKTQILSLVIDTLRKLGYSGEDIAMFSESITEKVLSDTSNGASVFPNM